MKGTPSIQGLGGLCEDSVTLCPLPCLGFPGAGGWERGTATVGVHSVAPGVCPRPLCAGKAEREAQLRGSGLPALWRHFSVCEHVRMNFCLVNGLEFHNPLQGSLTPQCFGGWCLENGNPREESEIYCLRHSTRGLAHSRGPAKSTCHFSRLLFSPGGGGTNPPLGSCSLTHDVPADPFPKPRGRLAAVHLGPGPRWEMHLHGSDPCSEHLLP